MHAYIRARGCIFARIFILIHLNCSVAKVVALLIQTLKDLLANECNDYSVYTKTLKLWF